VSSLIHKRITISLLLLAPILLELSCSHREGKSVQETYVLEYDDLIVPILSELQDFAVHQILIEKDYHASRWLADQLDTLKEKQLNGLRSRIFSLSPEKSEHRKFHAKLCEAISIFSYYFMKGREIKETEDIIEQDSVKNFPKKGIDIKEWRDMLRKREAYRRDLLVLLISNLSQLSKESKRIFSFSFVVPDSATLSLYGLTLSASAKDTSSVKNGSKGDSVEANAPVKGSAR
jgi:hypothetical protein